MIKVIVSGNTQEIDESCEDISLLIISINKQIERIQREAKAVRIVPENFNLHSNMIYDDKIHRLKKLRYLLACERTKANEVTNTYCNK